jgi:hypothetical protein
VPLRTTSPENNSPARWMCPCVVRNDEWPAGVISAIASIPDAEPFLKCRVADAMERPQRLVHSRPPQRRLVQPRVTHRIQRPAGLRVAEHKLVVAGVCGSCQVPGQLIDDERLEPDRPASLTLSRPVASFRAESRDAGQTFQGVRRFELSAARGFHPRPTPVVSPNAWLEVRERMLADQLDYVVGVDPHRDSHALAVVEAVTGAVVLRSNRRSEQRRLRKRA